MRKRLVIAGIIAGILLILSVGLTVTGYSPVVGIPEMPVRELNLAKGARVNPIRDFATPGREDGLSACLLLDPSEFPLLHPSIPRYACLKTDAPDLIRRIRDEWNLVYREADVATVLNRLLIFEGDSLIFSAGIALQEGMEGLQCREYGWVTPSTPNTMIDICSRFSPVYSPIIIF